MRNHAFPCRIVIRQEKCFLLIFLPFPPSCIYPFGASYMPPFLLLLFLFFQILSIYPSTFPLSSDRITASPTWKEVGDSKYQGLNYKALRGFLAVWWFRLSVIFGDGGGVASKAECLGLESAPKCNSYLTLSKSISLSFNVYISNIKVTIILFTQDCCKNLMREYMWKGPACYIFSMNNVTIIVAYNDNTRCYKSLECKRQVCWSLTIKKGEAGETLSHSLSGLRKWKSLVTRHWKQLNRWVHREPSMAGEQPGRWTVRRPAGFPELLLYLWRASKSTVPQTQYSFPHRTVACSMPTWLDWSTLLRIQFPVCFQLV